MLLGNRVRRATGIDKLDPRATLCLILNPAHKSKDRPGCTIGLLWILRYEYRELGLVRWQAFCRALLFGSNIWALRNNWAW